MGLDLAGSALQIYRPELIIALGLASMLIRSTVFHGFSRWVRGEPQLGSRNGLLYGLGIGVLHPMASIPDHVVPETALTVPQFLIVGPFIASISKLIKGADQTVHQG